MSKPRTTSPNTPLAADESAHEARDSRPPRSELERVLQQPRASEEVAPQPAGSALGFGLGSTLIADVLRVGNANDSGRLLATWRGAGGTEHSAWLPMVRGLAPRIGDRVLLTLPGNASEPLVVAIVDGASSRPVLPTDERGSLNLRAGESLAIRDAAGTDLVRIVSSEKGAVIQLAEPDLRLEVPGTLSLHAGAIELRASERKVEILANDDVEIKGERVHIN